MTHTAHLCAQMLRQGRRALAELVGCRLEYSLPANQPLAYSAGFAIRVEQLEAHICALAACIEFSSPALLDDYVRWAGTLADQGSSGRCEIAGVCKELVRVVQQQFPKEISKTVENYVDRALQSLETPRPGNPASSVDNPLQSLQQKYLTALLAAHRDEALHVVLDAADSGVDIESIYMEVIQPSLWQLGEMWHTGEICVAQEHYCTAATQFVMSQLQPYFLTDQGCGQTLVATCVGDELHEVGLRIVADLFELNGWHTIYLGANSPATSIAKAIVTNQAEWLAVSVTMIQHLFALEDLIRLIRSHPGCEQVKLLVGGRPFNVDPLLWNRLSADAMACDAREAIRITDPRPQTPAEPEGLNAGRAELHRDSAPALPASSSAEDDLSRLNNSLVTLQRQLHKVNVALAASNKANQDKAEALERADRRKDEFLAMLAHELRGPLAPMELALAVLQQEGLTPSIEAEARETLKRQLQQMGHLINDLLDASRIAHGKIELQQETLDVANTVHRAVEIAQPLITDKQQRLKLDLSDNAALVEGDAVRLTQVFANLLVNASKYTAREGQIWLSLRCDDDTVRIEVRDNGVGIEAELLPDVFSAFTQESRSKQFSMGGLGLGLSLVKQLVELHRGTVTAHSEGADRGSVFTVTLPLSRARAELVKRVDPEISAPNETSSPARRVLIVEDTSGIARMTAILLEKLGHQPEIAFDGASAIQLFKKSKPELVILDLMLPDMSGLEVTRRLRQLDPQNATLIVALTGHSDDKHRRMAKESGCDEYLVKPVDVRDLKRLSSHPKLLKLH